MSSRRERPSTAASWCFDVASASASWLRPSASAAGLPRWPGLASLALHVVTVLALTLTWHPRPAAPDEVPPIEVEMIQRAASVQGATASAAQPPPSPPSPPATDQGVIPATVPTPRAPERVETNLGGLEDSTPLSVTSENMRPPEPDSRFRNLPPEYPPEALRVHAEGTVQLLVHVTSRGYPSALRIVRSSGNAALDEAALRAVQLWRFRPAKANGLPVPFDYPQSITFTMGER